jgi:hypothetical protein
MDNTKKEALNVASFFFFVVVHPQMEELWLCIDPFNMNDYIRRQGDEGEINLLPVAGAHFLAVRCGCYGVHVVLHGPGSAGPGEHYRK